jgi:hypothetical protein
MSDMDDGGVCPECRQRKEGLPCYNEASTTERRWDRGGQDAHKVESSAESSARGCIAVQGLGKYAQEGRNTGTSQVCKPRTECSKITKLKTTS